MKITEVTEHDAVMAASLSQTMAVSEKLMDALKLAGLPVSGPGLDKRTEAARWLVGVMHQMVDHLRASKAASAAPTMKIKAMGPMGGGMKKKKGSKKQ